MKTPPYLFFNNAAEVAPESYRKQDLSTSLRKILERTTKSIVFSLIGFANADETNGDIHQSSPECDAVFGACS